MLDVFAVFEFAPNFLPAVVQKMAKKKKSINLTCHVEWTGVDQIFDMLWSMRLQVWFVTSGHPTFLRFIPCIRGGMKRKTANGTLSQTFFS